MPSIYKISTPIPLLAIILLFTACGAIQNTKQEKEDNPEASPSITQDQICLNTKKYFTGLANKNRNLPDKEFKEATGISTLEAEAWRNSFSGKNSNKDQSTLALAVNAAAMADSKEFLEEILKTNINEDTLTTGLIMAAQCGNISSLKLLIAHGAKPNSKNDEGVDSVIASLATRHFDATKALLEAGYESCGVTTKNGNSIKILAENLGAHSIIKMLPDCP